jgi:hypothetical protein
MVHKCCMCKKNEESVHNLLLHCEVACVLWNAFFSHSRLSWVIPRRVVDLLIGGLLVALEVSLCGTASCGRE